VLIGAPEGSKNPETWGCLGLYFLAVFRRSNRALGGVATTKCMSPAGHCGAEPENRKFVPGVLAGVAYRLDAPRAADRMSTGLPGPTGYRAQDSRLTAFGCPLEGLGVTAGARGGGAGPWLAARVLLAARSWLTVARTVPIGPGGLQSGFSTLRYVRRDFRKKKSGPRTPRPPGGSPVLGSLVWRAEGLPSTRNWPFWWPLPPTSPPQVISKAM
jgi:hypothetical protein